MQENLSCIKKISYLWQCSHHLFDTCRNTPNSLSSSWKISGEKNRIWLLKTSRRFVCPKIPFGNLQSQHTVKLELQIKLLLLYVPCRWSEPCLFFFFLLFFLNKQTNPEQNRNPPNTPTALESHSEEMTFRRAFVPSELKMLICIWYTTISADWIAGRAGYWGVRVCC